MWKKTFFHIKEHGMTHFILHNPQAANGNGMEIYEISETKKMLDRVMEIFDGDQMNPISKEKAGMLIDGRISDLLPRKSYAPISEMRLSSTSNSKTIYIYAATMGRAQ